MQLYGKLNLYPSFSSITMTNSLREIRKKRKITQEQLAELVGVSRQSINAIERGKYTPSTVLSLKISEVFNTSVNKIFELEASDYEK